MHEMIVVEFYRSRIKEVQINYTAQRQKLIDSLNEERVYIQSEQKRSLDELKNSMSKMTEEFETQSREARLEIYVKEEDLRNTVLTRAEHVLGSTFL
jgi:polyhydroxyalkanoate synthesis regulator phasin